MLCKLGLAFLGEISGCVSDSYQACTRTVQYGCITILQSGIDVPPDYLFFRKMHTRTFLLQPPPPLINFEPRGNFPNQTKNCLAKVTRCECLLH